MATYKVGQRVKKVAPCTGENSIPIGAVGTIAGYSDIPGNPLPLLVSWDGIPTFYAKGHNAADYMLAPLTDDKESFQRFMDTLLRTDTPLVMYARALDMAGK